MDSSFININSSFIEALQNSIRDRDYSAATEEAYIYWIKYYLQYFEMQHPADMHNQEVVQFMNYLEASQKISAPSRNQALNALVYIYKHILHKPLGDSALACRSKIPIRLPTILNRDEIKDIISHLEGVHRIIGALLYGSGLRLTECLQLRINDINFNDMCLHIRDDRHKRDRYKRDRYKRDRNVVLPESLITPLKHQIQLVLISHQSRYLKGFKPEKSLDGCSVPHTTKDFHNSLLYLFPRTRIAFNPNPSDRALQQHLPVSTFQKAIRTAVNKAGIDKKVSASTLRHTFATHELENGESLQSVQEQLGHSCPDTTLIYARLANGREQSTRNPLEEIFPSRLLSQPSTTHYTNHKDKSNSTVRESSAQYRHQTQTSTEKAALNVSITAAKCPMSLLPVIDNLVKSHQPSW